MKEKDLFVEFEAQKLVYYVEKEDKSYGPIISGSQLSANYLDDFWAKRIKLEENLRKEILDNQKSPIYYYMILQEIGPKDLAKRVGLNMRKLEKLFIPKYFSKLRVEKLTQFAEVFNIPLSMMFQTFLIKESDRETIQIEHLTTNNDYYNITRIFSK